jgi:hypothetical protein
MKQKILIFSFTFITALTVSIFPVNAVAKAGAKCSTLGVKTVVGKVTLTCIKSGKKQIWSSGKSISAVRVIDVKQIYSTDDGYFDDLAGPFALDPRFPAEWQEVKNSFEQNRMNFGQVRLAKYYLGSARPSASFQNATDFNNVDLCKITSAPNWNSLSFPDEWQKSRRHPGPNSVVQLIPIYAEDTAKPVNSPTQDYLKYLNLLKEWIDYSSDFGSDAKIRIPDQYIKFPNKVEPYKLYHPVNRDTPGHVRFNQDVISAVDPLIDFSGANIGIVVAPPGTDASIMQQAALGSFRTAEGLVISASSQFATLATNMNKAYYAGLGQPFWWIHELYHVGYGLDDHYGDAKNDLNTDYGMGWWTMMTPFGGDLSVWEKWILGFVQDSQIQCVLNPKSSNHWLAPASVKTQESKAIIIPVSKTKVVVAESIRPAGLHYKIPQKTQGVIVYEIDLTQNVHGMGMKLSLPTNRQLNPDPFAFGFFLGDAALRKGDRTISNGITFEVTESGTFGDVIKVSAR